MLTINNTYLIYKLRTDINLVLPYSCKHSCQCKHIGIQYLSEIILNSLYKWYINHINISVFYSSKHSKFFTDSCLTFTQVELPCLRLLSPNPTINTDMIVHIRFHFSQMEPYAVMCILLPHKQKNT